MRRSDWKPLAGLSIVLTFFAALTTAQELPRTTSERIAGAPAVTTEQLKGTVVFVEGNRLVVEMANGGVRQFQVPPTRKFVIDGKELSVKELKTGTELTATVTTTKTPVTARTTTIGTGTVRLVSGNTVIVTLPNQESRAYTVNDSYRFRVGDQQASVHELKPGMTISAQKIVEEPTTEIVSNTVVTGHAPR